jgi:diacylglycerol O-acyltransferase / wax synthase
MDALLLYSETPNMHTHTLKIAVVDVSASEAFDFEMFRRTFLRRLHLLEPLRYQLVGIPWRLHHPMWLENCEIDPDYHLRRVQVASPGGRRELDRVIGEIASTPLDRRRPLWEFHFVEGMSGNRTAIVGKIHHALADGVASANLLARAFDSQGSAQDERDLEIGCVTPSGAELLRSAVRDHIQQVAELPDVIKATMSGISRVRRRARNRVEHTHLARPLHAPPTFMNHVVSPARTFASATLSLVQMKETARHLEVTINDAVLAMTASALRQLLVRYDQSADRPIVASVLASTDKSSSRMAGNELSGMPVSLPVHVADPVERMQLVALSTGIAKENYDLLGPELYGRWMTYLPSPLAPLAFRWLAQRDSRNRLFNLPISNVAGPRERGRFGGAPVSEIYSVGPLPPGCGINVTVWSYVDQLNISVIADDETLCDTHEMTDAMISAFVEMRGAAGLSQKLAPVEAAMPPAASAHPS